MRQRFRDLGDYQIDQEGETRNRTVTEADIVNFACLSGDYSPEHTDQHYMANSIYGKVVAHGQLGICLVQGMLSRDAPHIIGRGVTGAYLYGYDVNYRDAIKPGDTITIQWRVAEKADDSTQEGFGLVKTAYEVVNQEGNPVYDGKLITKVKKESAGNVEMQFKPGDMWEITEFAPEPGRIYCPDEYPIGGGWKSDGRTITETDIVNFASLTGDYDPQYIDAEFAKKSLFKERIAHGMLIFTIAMELNWLEWTHWGWRKTTIAGHLSDRATFLVPVKIGDTIRTLSKVLVARTSKSKPELAIAEVGHQIINQRNEVVQEGSVTSLWPSSAGVQGTP